MVHRNEMQTMRDVLLGESQDRRKLDQLVRQGMMSPAALPILHRGLDKLEKGQTMTPQERQAVSTVMSSLLYIVTGDDTVFQKARQHTQKTKYATEETETEIEVEETEIEEKMDMKKADMGDVIKDFQKSDAPQFKGKTKEKKREMAVAAKLAAEEETQSEMYKSPAHKKLQKFMDKNRQTSAYKDKVKSMGGKPLKPGEQNSMMSTKEETEQLDEYGTYQVNVKGSGGTTVKARSDKEASQKAFKRMGIANRHRNTMSHTVKPVKTEDYSSDSEDMRAKAERKAKRTSTQMARKEKETTPGMKEESPAPDNLDNSYKAKFAAMLKKTGKSLAQMSDDEKKKFFNSVDAAHKAKNEEMQTTGPGVKMGKPLKGVGGKPKKVGGKLSHPPREPNRLKPDPAFTKNEENVDEGAMSRMATQAAEKQRLGPKKVQGTGLDTYKKKPAAPGIKEDSVDEASAADVLKKRYASNRPEDNPQATKRVKDAIPGVTTHKTHPNAGLTNRGYSKKGKMAALKKQHARRPEQYGITREEFQLLDEGDYAVVSTNGPMISKKSKVHGYVKTMPKGKNLNKLLDKHGADRVIHKDKMKSSNVSEASAYADARRAMRSDSKGMAQVKGRKGTQQHKGPAPGEEKHGGHIVMQLRKAISVNKPVKFKDGSTHQISKAHAHKFLSKYNSGKPAEKEAMHSAHASHDEFKKHI